MELCNLGIGWIKCVYRRVCTTALTRRQPYPEASFPSPRTIITMATTTTSPFTQPSPRPSASSTPGSLDLEPSTGTPQGWVWEVLMDLSYAVLLGWQEQQRGYEGGAWGGAMLARKRGKQELGLWELWQWARKRSSLLSVVAKYCQYGCSLNLESDWSCEISVPYHAMNNAIKITPWLGENHGMFRSPNYFQAILANLFVLGTLFDLLLPCVWWFLNLFSWYNVGRWSFTFLHELGKEKNRYS